MQSTKKNFIYNFVYQLLILIIPLITSPYLARTLGATGIGKYSYTYSIVSYFMMFVLLGLNNYGNRTIAKNRYNITSLSRTFWSIYFLQLIIGIVIVAIYIGFIFTFGIEYRILYLIEFLYLISSILDINWFFFGVEKFKKTVIRNGIIKILTVILIFIFVKDTGDLYVYTFIMSFMALISQIILWGFIRTEVIYVRVSIDEIVKHIKPNLVLFISVIAISLYKIMDKIMLGMFCDVTEVAYFENAEKIISIPMTLITALGTVMLPKISNVVSSGQREKSKVYIEKSIEFLMFMSFPMCFGLFVIGEQFAPIYFGNEFIKSGILIKMLAFTLPFLSFANVIRTQFLIPNERDKDFIISVILGAIINVILNLIFIPKLDSVGACIGTIAAEFTVMAYQIFAVKNDLDIKKYIEVSLQFLLKSLVMYLLIWAIGAIIRNELVLIFVQIISGVIIYGLINIKYIFNSLNLDKFKRNKRLEGEEL